EDRGPCTAEPTLERAVLRLHALSCAGALAAAADDQSLATKFDLRARSALDEFEARYWSPSRAAFVESADTDEPASLFACAIGMLATTGDRTAIHGQSALAERSVGRVPDPERTLVAMAQFDAARGDLLADLLMQPTDDPHRAGLAIDAVLFAATGMRMATGPGMDEAWTRLRPCLPTGIDRIAVRGLVHDGHACEFEYERRHDEHVGRYTLRREGDGKGWRQLVVHQDGRTFVAPAIDGEPVTLTSTAPTAAQPRDRATSNPSR
ncbi:MAG: hypothetical protein ABL997_19280, partial [Planctomycetota bacterium]